MDYEEINSEIIEKLIDDKNVKEIRQIFELIPTIDIAEACNDIEDVKKLVFIFKTVKSDYTADFYTELNDEVKEELISIMSDADLVEILEDQFTDDLVDDLEQLPANIVKKVLKNVSKERRTIINKILNLKDDTAGTLMTTEFLELKLDMSVDQAIKEIRSIGKEKETIYTIFIRDSSRKFVGTLDLDDLIFAKPNDHIDDIMNKDFVVCHINDDQEEVAQTFKRYDLNALAVLNDDERLVGIITIDDIVDVIEEEATEDMSKMALVAPLENSYLETGVFKMALNCAPWLICLLILGTFSSMILSSFEETLTLLPVLVPFITVLMDTGGNAGGQTTTLMVRGLAVNEFEPKDYFKILWKEMRVALVTASFVCLFSFLWFLAEMYLGIVSFPEFSEEANAFLHPSTGAILNTTELFFTRFQIAGIVSLTLFVGILTAKFVGTSLPMLVAKLKKDPALISTPFVTTIVDVTSLLVYFVFATILFNVFGLFH